MAWTVRRFLLDRPQLSSTMRVGRSRSIIISILVLFKVLFVIKPMAFGLAVRC